MIRFNSEAANFMLGNLALSDEDRNSIVYSVTSYTGGSMVGKVLYQLTQIPLALIGFSAYQCGSYTIANHIVKGLNFIRASASSVSDARYTAHKIALGIMKQLYEMENNRIGYDSNLYNTLAKWKIETVRSDLQTAINANSFEEYAV